MLDIYTDAIHQSQLKQDYSQLRTLVLLHSLRWALYSLAQPKTSDQAGNARSAIQPSEKMLSNDFNP